MIKRIIKFYNDGTKFNGNIHYIVDFKKSNETGSWGIELDKFILFEHNGKELEFNTARLDRDKYQIIYDKTYEDGLFARQFIDIDILDWNDLIQWSRNE